MGIFDSLQNFKKNRRERQIEKSLRHIKNPKAMKEDRAAAIDFFVHDDDASIAVPALLARFDYSLEHGINDSREKEKCLEGIVRFKEKAIPFLTEHLKKTSRIAWPIKALQRVSSEDDLVSALKSCLDFGDIAFDQAKTDKNFDLLCYLRDYQLPGFVDSLAPFLRAADERVRYAACEVIIEQDDPKVPALIEPFLSDHSAENTRLHQIAIEAFLNKKWRLQHPEHFQDGFVSHGIRVTKAGNLEKN